MKSMNKYWDHKEAAIKAAQTTPSQKALAAEHSRALSIQRQFGVTMEKAMRLARSKLTMKARKLADAAAKGVKKADEGVANVGFFALPALCVHWPQCCAVCARACV